MKKEQEKMKMKDSGIEWIGKIPYNWELVRLQWNLDEIKEINSPVKTNLVLSLTNKLGVIPYEEKGDLGNKAKESIEEYKVAYPNTIVVNSMNILIGSVGICNYLGCVSPVYYVFKSKENSNLKFLNYIFQTEQFQKELRKYANGILEIRLRVSSAGILKRSVAIPMIDIQNRIVKTIENKTSIIDKLIRNEEHQIEKLKEYKQSLITEVVTKGLNKNVGMKDSGVEWIGKIPNGFNMVKVKHIGSCRNGLTYSPEEMCDENGILVLRSSNIKDGKLVFDDNVYVSKSVKGDLIVNKGDILICSRNGSKNLIGKNAIVYDDLQCTFGAFMMIFRSIYNTEYIYYILNSSIFNYYLGSYLTSTINQLTTSNFDNMVIPFVYDIQEQIRIVDYLKEKCKEIDSIIDIKQKKILKLNEYKKSLIYEYVTGKKEV